MFPIECRNSGLSLCEKTRWKVCTHIPAREQADWVAGRPFSISCFLWKCSGRNTCAASPPLSIFNQRLLERNSSVPLSHFPQRANNCSSSGTPCSNKHYSLTQQHTVVVNTLLFLYSSIVDHLWKVNFCFWFHPGLQASRKLQDNLYICIFHVFFYLIMVPHWPGYRKCRRWTCFRNNITFFHHPRSGTYPNGCGVSRLVWLVKCH